MYLLHFATDIGGQLLYMKLFALGLVISIVSVCIVAPVPFDKNHPGDWQTKKHTKAGKQ